jgi:hypothetical protein
MENPLTKEQIRGYIVFNNRYKIVLKEIIKYKKVTNKTNIKAIINDIRSLVHHIDLKVPEHLKTIKMKNELDLMLKIKTETDFISWLNLTKEFKQKIEKNKLERCKNMINVKQKTKEESLTEQEIERKFDDERMLNNDDKIKINEILNQWYKLPAVKFEIIKSTKNREFSVLVPKSIVKHFPEDNKNNIRFMRMHSIQNYDYLIWKMILLNNESNPFYENQHKIIQLYTSVATYTNGIPIYTPIKEERKKLISLWRTEYKTNIKSYDLFIDIDAQDHTEIEYCHQSLLLILDFYNKHNIPFSVVFSGMGFHVITDYNVFKELELSLNPDDVKNIYSFFKLIAENLNRKFSEMVDLKIFDSMRLKKIPYSLSIYNDEIYVCIPLNSDTEIKEFKLENYRIEKWLSNELIKNRGIRTFNNRIEPDLRSFLSELDINIEIFKKTNTEVI